MMWSISLLLILLIFVKLSCALSKQLSPPQQFYKLSSGGLRQAKKVKINWWHQFHDKRLNLLINRAISSNLALKASQFRIAIAKANYGIVKSQYYPTVTAKAAPATVLTTPNQPAWFNQVIGLDVQWRPDIFTKNYHLAKQANNKLAAVRAEHNAVLLGVISELTQAYIQLRGYQAAQKVLASNIKSAKLLLHIFEERRRSGFERGIEIIQERSLIESHQASFAKNQADIDSMLRKIEFLTGNSPDVLTIFLSKPGSIPWLKNKITTHMLVKAIRQRPDVIAAERLVQAAKAGVGASIANVLPNVGLGYYTGWQSSSMTNIFQPQNRVNQLFGLVSIPILNIGDYKAIGLNQQQENLALIQYQEIMLRSLSEVATYYSFYNNYFIAAMHSKQAVLNKKLALALSKKLYKKGVTNFLTVLTDQEGSNELALQYIKDKVACSMAVVSLYKALGEGA